MLDSGLLEAAGHALKAVHRLFPEPLHDASSAVAVGDVIAERGKTLWLASLLHFRELFYVGFLIFDRAPMVFPVVHGGASRTSSLRARNQPLLSGPAAPAFTA